MVASIKTRKPIGVILFLLIHAVFVAHHHHDFHSCAHINGEFSLIEFVGSDSKSGQGEDWVPVHLKPGHEHELCGVCHHVPSLAATPLLDSEWNDSVAFGQARPFRYIGQKTNLPFSRGPPQIVDFPTL
ncbi:MAG: hypothetical protein KDC71_22065 [Acidobacteria bacterium]|nr:hypothetical protein [Acidobacteriota bacterium]